MKTNNFNRVMSSGALALIAGIGLLLPATQAKAQSDGNYQAPPVNSGNYGATESVNNVFNWQDVPQNQIVPIDRAVFDQGGYQLYDQAGETIVVPFQNNNLYVMKFAVSQNGTTYFVNDAGQAPVLYLPSNGYLENATAPGSRWYPFNQRFRPETPVFLGIAPSYSDYVNMGWYPNEVCYGGYYGNVSFVDGGYFGPTLGLTFIFGGHDYYGWNGYRHYAALYPAPYHVGYFDRNNYRIGGRPDSYRRDSFIGSNGQGFHPARGNFGGSSYSGSGRTGFNGASRQNINRGGQYPFSGGSGFRGTTTRSGFGGATSGSGFRGTTTRPGFGGTTSPRPSFGGTASPRPGFGGGTSPRAGFGGGSAPRPSFGGGQSPRSGFGGGGQAPRPSGGGGGGARPSGGGGSAPRPNGR